MRLEILSERPTAGGRHELDIVAIHGLFGDYLQTWTFERPKAPPPRRRIVPGRAPSPQVDPDPCWIKDWLSDDIPGTRIMSFDYNADIFGTTTLGVADIASWLLNKLDQLRKDCKKRPLVFIAHSLGGIVCKKALVGTRLKDKYKDIASATQGILFFGTPHKGSAIANLASGLVGASNFFMRKPSSKFLDELKPDNAMGDELTTAFIQSFGNLRIISFYESEHIGHGSRDILVKKSSAVIGLPNEEAIPIESGHQEMCKFLLRTHQAYTTCCYEIKQMMEIHDPHPALAGAQEQHLQRALNDSQDAFVVVGADTAANDNEWALIRASFKGKFDEVRSLLERGADSSFTDEKGSTSLCKAAQMGHARVVKLLLENGADISHANNDGWTPLYEASFHGHSSIVQLLLKHGADPCVTNKDGWTPLHEASRYGYYNIARILLQHGADLSAISDEGAMPINKASQYGHPQIVKLLLDVGADPSNPNKDGWTPLHEASNYGYLAIVQLLLDRRSDISFQNRWGETALHRAAITGQMNVVRTLLERGADPSVTDTNGNVAAFRAAEHGHPQVSQLLGHGF